MVGQKRVKITKIGDFDPFLHFLYFLVFFIFFNIFPYFYLMYIFNMDQKWVKKGSKMVKKGSKMVIFRFFSRKKPTKTWKKWSKNVKKPFFYMTLLSTFQKVKKGPFFTSKNVKTKKHPYFSQTKKPPFFGRGILQKLNIFGYEYGTHQLTNVPTWRDFFTKTGLKIHTKIHLKFAGTPGEIHGCPGCEIHWHPWRNSQPEVPRPVFHSGVRHLAGACLWMCLQAPGGLQGVKQVVLHMFVMCMCSLFKMACVQSWKNINKK